MALPHRELLQTTAGSIYGAWKSRVSRMSASLPFRPDDPVPLFKARASNGNASYDFSSAGGRYMVLCFLGPAASEAGRHAMAAAWWAACWRSRPRSLILR
jgi:hypothetical protein